MLSVFRYKIATQTPKTNAEKMDPNPCRDANNRDDTNIANVVGMINRNLLRKTPLKINSSEIGEIIMVANRLPDINELKRFPDGTMPKTKFERYNIPYDRNMFRITTKKINLSVSNEKALEISSLVFGISSLSLKIKKKMMKI